MKTTCINFKMIVIILLMLALATTLLAQEIFLPATTKSEEAKQLYIDAMDAFAYGEYVEGRAYALKALQKDSNFFMAYFLLTFNNDKDEKAKYANLISDYKGKLNKGEKILKKITIHNKTISEDIPLDLYKELTNIYPEVIFNKIMLCYNLSQLNKTDEAFAVITDAEKLAPSYPPIQNIKGYILMTKDDLPNAKIAFDKYAKLAPERANAYDSKGDYFMTVGKYKMAKQQFSKAYSTNNNFTFSKEKAKKAEFSYKCKIKKPEVEKLSTELVDYYNDRNLKKFQSFFVNNGSFRMVINAEKSLTLQELNKMQFENMNNMDNFSLKITNQIVNMINPQKAVATQKFTFNGESKDGKTISADGNWSIFWMYWKDKGWKIIYAVEDIEYNE